MTSYTCPTCGNKIERDLVLFYKHTDRHILEELEKQHPQWVTNDGYCPKCLDFFKKAMGKTGAPQGAKPSDSVLVNIGIGGARRRTVLGVLSLAAAAGIAFGLVSNGAPRIWRLVIFFPLLASALGFLQAKERICVVLGGKGTREAGGGEEKVADPRLERALRQASQRIWVFAAAFGLVLAVIFYGLPLI